MFALENAQLALSALLKALGRTGCNRPPAAGRHAMQAEKFSPPRLKTFRAFEKPKMFLSTCHLI